MDFDNFEADQRKMMLNTFDLVSTDKTSNDLFLRVHFFLTLIYYDITIMIKIT